MTHGIATNNVGPCIHSPQMLLHQQVCLVLSRHTLSHTLTHHVSTNIAP